MNSLSRIKSDNIRYGNNFVLPIEQSNVTRQEVKLQKMLQDAESQQNEILENANKQANKIIEDAKLQASAIIDEAHKKAITDSEITKKQGYDEGYKQGLSDGNEQFKKDAELALTSLETIASSSFEMKQTILNSADKDIVELLIAIADKVCHKAFDEEMLLKITTEAIKQLKDKEEITIIINPELADRISKFSNHFREKISQLKSIKIIEDSSLSCDGTIVESPLSRVDARISSKINEIAEQLMNGASDELQQE